MNWNNKSLIENVVLPWLKLVLVLPAFIFIFSGYAMAKTLKIRPAGGHRSVEIAVPQGVLQKAARQGHFYASYMVGKMYYKGQGVDRDYSEAISWLREAAEQGYTDAQFMLDGISNIP